MRTYIKQHVIKSWKRCVTTDYKKQRINSERSLQASLWHHIYYGLKKHMRLFIEPTLVLDGGSKIRPDIVICNSRNIICVIELKYLPRGKPAYKKDINNLSLIASAGQRRERVTISNNRFRGIEADSTTYKLPKSVLYVWAGFRAEQKDKSYPLYSNSHEELKGCYLQLQAVTRADKNPIVLVNGRGKSR